MTAVRRVAKRAWPWLAGAALLAIIFITRDWYSVFGEEVRFTFDNRTDALLCYYPSIGDADLYNCLDELKPRAETRLSPGCGGGTKGQYNSRPISAVITVKEGGREIYNRTATCGGWNDTDRRFVIEQAGDEFIVTASLPDE